MAKRICALALSLHIENVQLPFLITNHALVGIVLKAPASRAADPDFDSRLLREVFSWSSHTSDLKITITIIIMLIALKCAI